MPIFHLAVMGLAALWLTGCGGGAEGRRDDAGRSAGFPQLPAPSALKLANFTEAGLKHPGADYIADLPHNLVSNYSTALVLTPQWTSNQQAAGMLAYACYTFDVDGYDRDEVLLLDWQSIDPATPVWIGCADFSRNRWDWRQAEGQSQASADFSALLDGGTTLCVAVLVLGAEPCTLDNIRVGADGAPVILDVPPLSGQTGTALTITANVTGTEPLDYAWNFGSGAVPSLSAARTPQLTLGAPGKYDCQLQVTNAAGSDTYYFKLDVALDPLSASWPMHGCNKSHNRRSAAAGPSNPQLAWTFRTTGPGFLLTGPAFGADGTLYLGGYEIGHYLGDNPELTALNPDGSVKWRSGTITPTTAPVVDADGTIYVGAMEFLCAFAPDGALLWSVDTGDYVFSPLTLTSSGRIVLGCSSINNVQCYNSDGTLAWSSAELNGIPCTAVSGIAEAPDGTLYFGTSAGSCYALNSDGSEKWRFDTTGAIWSTPLVGTDGAVFFGNNNKQLFALNPDGTQRWVYDTAPYEFVMSPVQGPDETIYLSTVYQYHDRKGRLFALSPDGTEQWHVDSGWNTWTHPAVATDGTVLMGDGYGAVTAYDLDGTALWTYAEDDDIQDSIFWAPIIGPDGSVYLTCYNGTFHALTAGGEYMWEYSAGARIVDEPVVDAAGVAYFTATDRYAYAVNPDGTPKWRVRLPGYSPVSPAIAPDGTLYVQACRSGYDTDPKLLAYSADGELLWEYEQGDFTGDLVVADDGALLCEDADTTPELCLLDPTGNVRWRCAIPGSYCNVCINTDGAVIYDTDESIVALTPSGAPRWTYTVPGEPFLYGAADNGTVFFQVNNNLAVLDAAGAPGWSTSGELFKDIYHVSIGAAGESYFLTYPAFDLQALQPDGTAAWAIAGVNTSQAPAIDRDGKIFITADSTSVQGGRCVLVLAPDGTELSRCELPGQLSQVHGYTGPSIGMNNMLYITNTDGKLYAITD